MPRNYPNDNMYRVLNAARDLNKFTQRMLQIQTGLPPATVCRWVNILVELRQIHLYEETYQPHGGPATKWYRRGPKPNGFRVRRPKLRTPLERSRDYRAMLKRTGQWEDFLARKRAMEKARKPKRDRLTRALFGEVK